MELARALFVDSSNVCKRATSFIDLSVLFLFKTGGYIILNRGLEPKLIFSVLVPVDTGYR